MNTMKTVYITPSTTDTRIILYRLGTDPGQYFLKTVNDNHEGLIDRSWDTQLFGSRPFEFDLTTDGELSAWLSEIEGIPLKVVTNRDRDLYFTLNGKRGYIAVSQHTRAYANFIGGGMYTLFELTQSQRREIADAGISLEEFLTATITAYGGVVVK